MLDMAALSPGAPRAEGAEPEFGLTERKKSGKNFVPGPAMLQ